MALGKPDDAIACLEAAAKYGRIATDWMRNDPDLDPLRDDRRFVALTAR